MAFVVDHIPQINQLCKALGMDAAMVHRLVLDLPVDGPVMCYAITFPSAEVFNPLVKFVQGAITTTPLPMSDTARMLANAVLAGELEAARALADEIVAECGGK